MKEELREYLKDLQTYLNNVEEFTEGGRDEFMTDPKTQFAVIRAYEVIGEIIKRLPDYLVSAQPDIDWRQVTRFRDFLAHNYEKIDLNYVWRAVEDLPTLRTAVEEILAKLDDEPENE